MGRYGYIQTADNIKEQLKKLNRDYEGRRTWGKLYGSIDLSRQQATSQAMYDYSSAVSEAYRNAHNEKASIASSNLGVGYKAAAMEDLDLALSEAYDSYRANYLQQVSSINTSAVEAIQGVDNELMKQAQNVKAYQDKPYEYLSYLYDLSKDTDKHVADDYLRGLFSNDAQWSKYLTEELDEDGYRRLISKDELYSKMYDKYGNLTIRGADFYDQMLNQLGSEAGTEYGFSSWLASNDEELYNWSMNYNPYDYAPDAYGNNTNLSSMRTMFGLTSSDETYQFIERFGGMSEEEVKSMFSSFEQSAIDLQNRAAEGKSRDSKAITEDVTNMVNNVKTLAKQLGIVDEVEQELGMSWEELISTMDYNYNNAVTNGDIWWENILASVSAVGSMAGIGATIGSRIGRPLAGTILGAIAGLIEGTVSAIYSSVKTKKSNRELAKSSSDAYANLVAVLTDFALAKRREKELEFNKS